MDDVRRAYYSKEDLFDMIEEREAHIKHLQMALQNSEVKVKQLEARYDKLMQEFMKPIEARIEPDAVLFCAKCGKSIIEDLKKDEKSKNI